jgi:HD-GYP domain-containing protein (c-di-GMP phosphodiesterase class II)
VVLVADLQDADAREAESQELLLARAMAVAACAREGVAEQHAEEVSRLAAEVATRLGAPPATIARCRVGGLVHDVGKIAIADAIVLKPGPLDDAEWAEMRRHPALGEEIVLRVPELRDIACAVRHHHERFDGTGYPDGLAGHAIPLEARVLAAVDAYSAMTADRPYRRARPIREAVAELRRCAGTQLDPEVVSALLDALPFTVA